MEGLHSIWIFVEEVALVKSLSGPVKYNHRLPRFAFLVMDTD